MTKRILYIGRFELPDKEATANRVVANAKLLRDSGYCVELAGWSDDVRVGSGWQINSYFGFTCYEKHKAKSAYEKYKMFSDASPELSLLQQKKYDVIIAYDFPAVALRKIMRYCRRCNIRVICDVSEWYTNQNKNPLFRLVRMYDSFLRMRILHKKADGLIVISKYLQNYYRESKNLLIPPLVDITDGKWKPMARNDDGLCRFVYAGWPSKTKERLDIVVDALSSHPEKAVLDIYGIYEQKYREIYSYNGTIAPNIHFHGRVTHLEAVDAVKKANYSVIIRESCRKNNAGFPSKMVESISSGTPVLITNISNVVDYVGNGNNGYIVSANDFADQLPSLIDQSDKVTLHQDAFDYRCYIDSCQRFMAEVCP